MTIPAAIGKVDLVSRTSCYCQKPTVYEISCDLCGGSNITWSEYEHMIWCYDCQKDTPGNGGIFDGPIPMNLCEAIGISFDKIEIPSGDKLYIHTRDDGKIYWDKNKEAIL
jgi:hypothetical protein